MKIRFLAATVLFVTWGNVYAEGKLITRAYLDKYKNVHVVTLNGKDIRITRSGKCQDPEVSKDNRSLASICDHPKNRSYLALYRNGIIKVVKGDPFVREFKFRDEGRKIAIEFGGLHFAGEQTLYEIPSLKLLAEFSEWKLPPEERPPWSTDND